MAETKLAADHPDYFKLSDGDRVKVRDQDFKLRIEGNQDFQAMDPATQAKVKLGHQQLWERTEAQSQHNPIVQKGVADQRAYSVNSGSDKIVDKAIESHKSVVTRAGMVDDVLPDGSVDPDFAKSASIYLQKQAQRPVSMASKQLAADITKFKKALEKDGVWNDTKAFAGLAWDIVTNPGAVGEVTAESASSITAMGTGAFAGSKAGAAVGTAVAGPAGTAVGATVGSAAGMFAAGAADASTHKLLEQIQAELDKNEMAYTPVNIQRLMDNKEWVKQAQKTASQYGGVLGAIDIALGGFGSKLATLPTKVARRQAIQSMGAAERAVLRKVAKEEGITVREAIDGLVNIKTHENLAARSFKAKLKDKGVALGAEIASEPISEAVATSSIGQEVTAEDLIYETIGGVGAGPYGTAVNIAALGTKVGGEKAAKKFKQALASTPESRAEIKQVKEEGKAKVAEAKKVNQARNDVNYDTEVAETEVTDPKVEAWADPENKEEYNPLKAVEVLAKSENIEDLERADQVGKKSLEKLMGDIERSEEIRALQEEGKSTPALDQELGYLEKAIPEQYKTQQQIKRHQDKLRNRIQAAREGTVATEIDADNATAAEAVNHITETFGSSQQSAFKREQLQAKLKDPNISEPDKALIQAQLKADVARENVQTNALTPGKTQEEVANDIYNGGRGSNFRGIDSFKQGLKHYLSEGVNNPEMAMKELNRLRDFSDRHNKKAKLMADVFAAIEADPTKPLSPALQKAYDEFQKDSLRQKVEAGYKKPQATFINGGSGRLVASVQSEAAALKAEVALAEEFVRSHGLDPQTKVAPEQKSASQAKPAPKTAPKPVAKKPSQETFNKARAWAKKMIAAGANEAQIAKAEKQWREKHGDQVAQAYLNEIEAGKAKSPIYNQPETVPQAEETQTTKVAEEAVTAEEESATVPDNLAEFADQTLDDYEVTVPSVDGTTKPITYKEAIAQAKQELKELQDTLICCNR